MPPDPPAGGWPVISWEIRLRLAPGEHAGLLAQAWAWLASLPAYDPARLETEAQLHLFLARLAWREADRAREREAARARRQRGRAR